jgi:hypothetical protein
MFVVDDDAETDLSLLYQRYPNPITMNSAGVAVAKRKYVYIYTVSTFVPWLHQFAKGKKERIDCAIRRCEERSRTEGREKKTHLNCCCTRKNVPSLPFSYSSFFFLQCVFAVTFSFSINNRSADDQGKKRVFFKYIFLFF